MTVHLDVYDTRHGPWNPEHGDLEIPKTGSSFLRGTPSSPGR
jgi:hypothetical protein